MLLFLLFFYSVRSYVAPSILGICKSNNDDDNDVFVHVCACVDCMAEYIHIYVRVYKGELASEQVLVCTRQHSHHIETAVLPSLVVHRHNRCPNHAAARISRIIRKHTIHTLSHTVDLVVCLKYIHMESRILAQCCISVTLPSFNCCLERERMFSLK